MFCAGAWRRRGDDASLHDGGRRWPRQTKHRHVTLPVPLYGTRRQEARSAEACPGCRPRRRGRGITLATRRPAHRRREILWRPDDIAGSGGRAASRRSRARISGISAAPAGRPSKDRTDHLFKVRVPMLFLQGTRDALADLGELKPLCEALGSNATLKLFADADHSFHAPARGGHAPMRRCWPNCWMRWPAGLPD